MTTSHLTSEIVLPDAPSIPKLHFRMYQGEADLPGMLAVLNVVRQSDQEERFDTLEEMTNNYAPVSNFDPRRDVLIAEVGSEIIAYSRTTWELIQDPKQLIFFSFGYIHPDWRRKGLGRAMLHFNQHHLREVAKEVQSNSPEQFPCSFESYASNFQPGNQALLMGEGYTAVRNGCSMICTDLQDVPDLPLPEGLEVRPVQQDQIRKIWDASQEAFRDHWHYAEPTEEDYQSWQKSREFQPDIWQVAWDGDQVAGMVLNFINHAENETFGRKRGMTEGISVRQPWRRRGLARTLLARSMRMHRELGMTETALGVDAENPHGARQLYESMGYRTVRVFTTFQKPMNA